MRTGFLKGLSALLLSFLLAACGGKGKGGAGDRSDHTVRERIDDGRAYVVATTTMIADLLRELGGDKIQVAGLMGPGVDPHLYEPVPADGIALREADLVVYNGLYLEGQMSEVLAAKGDKSLALGDLIQKDQLLGAEQDHPDPHIWGDAALWASCVDGVVKQLAAVDPDNAVLFQTRGAEVKAELLSLHDWATARVAEVPESARVLITSHDAFAYFGRAYGYQVVGLQGISTAGEVGIAERVKLVDFIKAKKVRAIFVESSVSGAAISSISQDTGVKVAGELFSDAMGEPGEMGSANGEEYDLGTYIGMLKHNVNTTVDALK